MSGQGKLTGRVSLATDGSGTVQNLYTAYYYDTRGRVTQAVQSNLLGGHDVTSTVYTFTGKPAVVSHTHTAGGKPTLTEVTEYTYDHAERLTKVEHTLGGVTVTLVENTYDELGRLLDAVYGEGTNIGTNAGRFTEKVTSYDKNGNILVLI